jgi:hypothetical protein
VVKIFFDFARLTNSHAVCNNTTMKKASANTRNLQPATILPYPIGIGLVFGMAFVGCEIEAATTNNDNPVSENSLSAKW